MKNMKFKIGDYLFSNKLIELESYFKKNEIEYNIKDECITFYVKLDDVWIECSGYIYKNTITKYHFYKSCKTEEESKILKRYITSNYPKEYDVNYGEFDYTVYTTYQSAGYKLLIRLCNSLDFNLDVSFENDKHKLFKNKMNTKEIIGYCSLILCAILGLFLTIQFIYFYQNNYDKNTLFVSAIISYLYMAISIFLMCLFSNVEFKKTVLWPILLPLAYILIVFIILILLSLNGSVFSIMDYLMWAIYSMPAFIIVILIIILLVVALGY